MANAATAEESGDAGGVSLTAAQKRRAQMQRERAAALRAARLAAPPASVAPAAPLLSAGGFMLDADAPEPAPERAPPPPVPDSERPRCERCDRLPPHSFLFDNFGLAVCDECRDADDECGLVTRTEAKAEFLLRDCDLDSREPALRCVRRRNPHRGGADMRLYVRAQVRERALAVWGSAEALAAERARRAARRGEAGTARRRRAVTQLRAALVAPRPRSPHRHRWAAETHLEDDLYSRRCLDCDHVETYEKM